MKKLLSSFVITLVLSLGFNGIFYFGNNKFNNAFIANSAYADESKEYQESDDLKPWEASRGWAPSIPYSNNYKPNVEVDATKKNDEKHTPKEDVSRPTQQDKGPVYIEKSVKPWEASRGWAPAVPYGN